MRRRSFIATLPLAAAGSMTSFSSSNALSQTDGISAKDFPKFQPAGAEKFTRPDVHAGDRIAGASFASRPAAMGCSGAAGTAHPLATLTAIEILKKGGSAIDAAVATWRERMRAHGDASYQQLIVNEGGGAGASLEHSHAQLYALGFVPAEVARERERAGAYAERTAGAGLLSDVLVEEVRRGERLVLLENQGWYRPRDPFLQNATPTRRRPLALSSASISTLCAILGESSSKNA